jgi:UDP-N-acetylglucosamine--N-acetylmuramyl-(pentapeptide) pyrophosphoryl-undecaprenol N-acetylglucosamine transferase
MKKSALGLTGGGTAGHVLPHFAIVSNPDSPIGTLVQSGQIEVVYFGGRDGMERDIVTQQQPTWRYIPLRTGKLRRYFSWQNFVDPFNILFGFCAAFFAMRKHRIACLFSKGGFVSAPVVWAAWLNRVPVVIHESDATPALATRLTLPFAQRAFVSFDETKKWIPARFRFKVRTSGIPIRSELIRSDKNAAMQFFRLSPNRPTLLIFGGSLGAEGLNRRVAQVLPQLSERWNVIHIVGKGKSFQADAGEFYRQYEFLSSEMALAYAVADLAICRAGASSIFELAAARVPMILVPLGLHQSRGDQMVNAKIFSAKGWASWIAEEELTPQRLLAEIEQIYGRHNEIEEELQNAPGAQTAAQLAGVLLSYVRGEPIPEPFD